MKELKKNQIEYAQKYSRHRNECKITVNYKQHQQLHYKKQQGNGKVSYLQQCFLIFIHSKSQNLEGKVRFRSIVSSQADSRQPCCEHSECRRCELISGRRHRVASCVETRTAIVVVFSLTEAWCCRLRRELFAVLCL